MKKIPFMLSIVIIVSTSFLAPIKVTGGRGGGGSRGGGSIGGGRFGGGGGGGFGYSSPPARDPNAPGTGYKGGIVPGGGGGKVVGGGHKGNDPISKPQPGDWNNGPPLIIKPKPPGNDLPKRPMPMPQQCKPEVRECIKTYVYGGIGRPKYRGSCCLKLKHSVKCMCKFLKSQDAELRNGANGILKGCRYHLRKPCPN